MMRIPVNVILEDSCIRVDGLPITLPAIAEILHAMAHPDPRRWMRFERQADYGIVHVKLEEQGPALKCASCHFITTIKGYVHCPYDGFILNTVSELKVPNGSSSEGVRTYREEAKNALDSRQTF